MNTYKDMKYTTSTRRYPDGYYLWITPIDDNGNAIATDPFSNAQKATPERLEKIYKIVN